MKEIAKMPEDFSTKRVLVWDTGNQTLLARRLGEFFGECLYFKSWQQGSPTMLDVVVGADYENVTRIKNVWDWVDKCDLIVFPDCLNGDLQLYLESKGKRIWGARRGSDLELDRIGAKKILKDAGLPVNPFRVIQGVDKLREEIKRSDNLFVKISTFRGDMESFPGMGTILTESRLDELAFRLGSVKNDATFLVEDGIDTSTEVGYDGINVFGQWPKTGCMQGYEVKDAGLLGVVMDYKDLPEEVRVVNDGVAPFLKKSRYAGNFSSEIRVKGKTPYAIDFTCRVPTPSGEIQIINTKNIAEVMYRGAVGELVDPEPEFKYGAEAMVYSDWGHRHWLNVEVDPATEQFITFFNSLNLDENHEAIVPVMQEIAVLTNEVGAVVGLGNTIEEAINHLKENAEGIKGMGVEIRIDSLAKAIQEIDHAQKLGMKFSDKPLPKPEIALT
jgi:phosphoribosylamine-glycine ligase